MAESRVPKSVRSPLTRDTFVFLEILDEILDGVRT
jgi:hypothetical protein